MHTENYYRVLGVHKYSKDADIKAAYSLLAKLNHPDLQDNDPVKADRMATINVAYSVLKSPKERKHYDKVLALTGVRCPTCEGSATKVKTLKGAKKLHVPCGACHGTGVL
jgi:molecular chaperone DnaJ